MFGLRRRALRAACGRLADRIVDGRERICAAALTRENGAPAPARASEACAEFLAIAAELVRGGTAADVAAADGRIATVATALEAAFLSDPAVSTRDVSGLGSRLRGALAQELDAVFDTGVRFSSPATYREVAARLNRAVEAFIDAVLAGLMDARANESGRRIGDLEGENQRLKQVAIRDGKTGLLNYDFFRERLQQELNRAIRYHSPVALIIADLDDFKGYNDAEGHLFGDRVLALVAALITQSARSSDLVGRFGGEEFAVVLPHTSMDGGITRAERIRAAVERAEFPTRDGRVAKLTISLGVAAYPLHGDTIDALIDAADAALVYIAKREGKNAVALAGDSGLAAADPDGA